jgi:hypothetical protein
VSRPQESAGAHQRIATDNDFDERIADGCRKRLDDRLITSIRDFDLGRAQDAAVLEWAATTGHVVITHDASTMTAAAHERLRRGLVMSGLVVVPQTLGVGEAVRRLVDLLERESDELDGRVRWI